MKIRNIFKIKKADSNPFNIQTGIGKIGRMKTGHRLDWTEQFFDSSKNEKETVGKNFNFDLLKKISYVLIIFTAIILSRTAWLQIARGQYYYNLAEGNRIRIERQEAKRGIIYDRNYNALVRNIANFLVYLVPADLPEDELAKEKIIDRVSQILGDVKTEDIKSELSKIKINSFASFQPLFIADNIAYEKAMQLYLETANMPGVILSNKTRREYNLYSLSLSHILGYTGIINENELAKVGPDYLPIDYIGKAGIESFWENELKGMSGKKQIEVDALGKEKRIINQAAAEDGHNLVLSLDLAAQKKLEELIVAELQKLKLNKAAAVVMNPSNGEIIAMVSLPSFNNNVFARGITPKEYEQLINFPDKALFNRCISGEYASGSTIKPVIAAAALEENIINENTIISSTGGLHIGEWFFPDWQAGGHGLTDVRRALAESINTFFYYIGGGYADFNGLGIDRMTRYAALFGLSNQTGVDLPGEARGFLPSKEWKESTKGERWYVGDTYHFAIGQGDILVTPLQVADYTAVFANGGNLVRPHFIRQVFTSDNKLIGNVEEKPIRSNFISEKNINIVREGLRQTVVLGSAQSLQSVPVAVAGKTGTAQWSTTKPEHAWFTGFAPYENPEVVITILIEQAGEGSAIAVPIANEFLSWYFGETRIKANN